MCQGHHREILRFAQKDSKPWSRPQRPQWPVLSSLPIRVQRQARVKPALLVKYPGDGVYSVPATFSGWFLRSGIHLNYAVYSPGSASSWTPAAGKIEIGKENTI